MSKNQTNYIPIMGGFLLGSITTIAAMNYFNKSAGKSSDDDVNETVTGNKDRELQITATSRNNFRQNSFLIAEAICSDGENINLISDIISRLWPHINVAASAMIRDTIEPMFKDIMPKALQGLHFTELDLGSVPIRLDNVVVHPLKDGMLQFDLDVTWKSDSNIKLSAGGGYIKFGVKSIHLSGRMIFTLRPLRDEIPIVDAIQYAFINPPTLELDFTGLASVAEFSAIDKTIQKIIQDILASMIVLPNRMLFKMDPNCDYRKIYQPPQQIARITCCNGRGFAIQQHRLKKDDIPDVYCLIQLGDEEEFRSSTIKNSLSPVWNESKDFLLSDNDQIVSLEVWDEDKGALNSDDYLGTAKATVGEILLSSGKTMELELMQQQNKSSDAYVTLRCDICNLTNQSLSSIENIASSSKNKICGLLAVVVTQAMHLPLLKKEEAASFVKVVYGKSEFLTGVVTDAPGIDALNPVFDIAFHVPIVGGELDKKGPIKLILMNGEKSLGETTVQFDALTMASNHTIAETRPLQSGGLALEFSVSLLGVEEQQQADDNMPVLQMTQPSTSQNKTELDQKAPSSPSLQEEPAANSSIPQTEQVRVSILSGNGFQIVKKRFNKKDIPDVYCLVEFGSSPKVWRTSTIKDSINPVWKNETNTYTLSNMNQVITLDVYDANKRGKDDLLGSARTTVGKVLLHGGKMKLELQENGGQGIGIFIEISCNKN